jgi:hypothetical protein
MSLLLIPPATKNLEEVSTGQNVSLLSTNARPTGLSRHESCDLGREAMAHINHIFGGRRNFFMGFEGDAG